jgi:hypothetical protein
MHAQTTANLAEAGATWSHAASNEPCGVEKAEKWPMIPMWATSQKAVPGAAQQPVMPCLYACMQHATDSELRFSKTRGWRIGCNKLGTCAIT